MLENGPELPALRWSSEAEARIDAAGLDDERLLLVLLRAVRTFASTAADGSPVSPVSVTIDHTARRGEGAALRFAMTLDRRTRTLVFAHGAAFEGDTQLVTATAVYRIE